MFAQRGRADACPGFVEDGQGRRRRHGDALRLSQGTRRHLRLAHLGHRHGHRLARRQPEVSNRSSRFSRGIAIRMSTSAPLAWRRRPGEAIGGWKPLGMVWNALASQYRLGFQAIERPHLDPYQLRRRRRRRRARARRFFDAFRRRHCYGATDNIVLDVRSGDHLMGDEFDRDRRPGSRSRFSSTAPGPSPRSMSSRISSTSIRPSPTSNASSSSGPTTKRRRPGLSWYYVRAVQDDGELAWGSPIWVRFPTARTAGK